MRNRFVSRLSVSAVVRFVRWCIVAFAVAVVLRQLAGAAVGVSNFPGHSTDVFYLALWWGLLAWWILEVVSIVRERRSPALSPLTVPDTPPPPSWNLDRRSRLVLLMGAGLVILVTYRSTLQTYLMTYADWNTQGSTSYLASAFPLPSIWTFGQFGSFAVLATRVSVPFALLSALARLGVSFAISERLVFILPFIVASWFGVRSLFRRLGAAPEVAVFAGLIYLINFSTIDWFAGGWYPILVAYGLTPLALSLLIRWVEEPTALVAVVLGITAGAVTILDVRNGLILFAAALVIVVLMGFSTERSLHVFTRTRLNSRLLGVLLGGVGFVLVLAPQLVSLWLNTTHHLNGPTLPSSYYDSSNLSRFSFYSLGDTMSLFNPWWPYFRFFQTVTLSPLPTASLLPVLALVGSVLVTLRSSRLRISRVTGLGLYLAGSAFAAGADSPFRSFNTFLWISVPGFHYFRNPELWMQLALLGALLVVPAVSEPFRDVVQVVRRREFRLVSLPLVGRSLLVGLVGIWALLQGVMVATETVSSPVSNLSAHTSAATEHVNRYLGTKSATVLWIPTSPAIATDHAMSSRQLTGVNLNPKNGITTFPHLSSGNVGAGSPIYPALFSTHSVAWSFINQYRIGYIVVDRFSPPWENIGFPNQASGTEASLQHLGLHLVFQNAEYGVYRANPTPLIEVRAFDGSAQPTSHLGPPTSFATSDFVAPATASTRNLSPTGGFAGHHPCTLAPDGCVFLQTSSATPLLGSLIHPFEMRPGDHVLVSVHYDTSQLHGGLLQVNQVCQGSTVSSSFFGASRGATTGTTEFEYTGTTPYTKCAITLDIVSASSNGNLPATSSALVSSITLQKDLAPFPLSDGPATSLSIAGTARGTAPLPHQIVPLAQHSWRISLSAASLGRIVTLWQSFSPGWTLSCPGRGQIYPTLVNGWATGFIVPPGGSLKCTLSFPPQATENLAVWASILGPAALFGGVWWVDRRRRRTELGRI